MKVLHVTYIRVRVFPFLILYITTYLKSVYNFCFFVCRLSVFYQCFETGSENESPFIKISATDIEKVKKKSPIKDRPKLCYEKKIIIKRQIVFLKISNLNETF